MNVKRISGKNYFNEESFKEICESLESGEIVSISISCIGHTRAVYESKVYMEKLQEKYGDRLLCSSEDSFLGVEGYKYKLSK